MSRFPMGLGSYPGYLQVARIVEELGCLPLAIEQAAAFVREFASDFATFLDDYHKNW